MNVSEMLNLLGLRLEDAAKNIFTDDLKLQTLNNAQDKLVDLINWAYLTELETLEEGLTATSGVLAFSGLSNVVMQGREGILKIKINGTNGKYCTVNDISDQKKLENTFLAGSQQNPVARLFGSSILISNGETNPSIDVFYMKMPTALNYKFDIQALAAPGTGGFVADSGQGLSAVDDAYNGAVVYSYELDSYHVVTDYVGATRIFTVEPVGTANFTDDQEMTFHTNDFDLLNLAGVTPDLNSSLHELMVTLAEMECWSMDRKPDRKTSAESAANNVINSLNAKYTKMAGLGTQGRETERTKES